jgi:BTB/POZ domain
MMKTEIVENYKIVNLNIGGTKYTTSITTLRKQDKSLLYKWFTLPDENLPKDRNGDYVIDRDGEVYRYILQYLRGPEFVYPEDEYALNLFLVECQYLQLELPVDKRWCFVKSSSDDNGSKHRYFISNRPVCLKTKFSLEMVLDDQVVVHVRQNDVVDKEDGSLFSFKFSGKVWFTFDAAQKKIFLKMAGGIDTSFVIKVAKFYISFENRGDFKFSLLD